ncbi:hypothetical protein ACFWAR_26070 [Streptomyces sp. NPDC059917]|uniref:hypothetical protein n=1 Tax=Streptomyces sp. NPDC059917 TaxID=3347002 RepID=UPI003656A010
MTAKEHRKPTPPSEAPGESGDRAARQAAEDAIVPGTKDGESGDAPSAGTEARRRTAERNEKPTS